MIDFDYDLMCSDCFSCMIRFAFRLVWGGLEVCNGMVMVVGGSYAHTLSSLRIDKHTHLKQRKLKTKYFFCTSFDT